MQRLGARNAGRNSIRPTVTRESLMGEVKLHYPLKDKYDLCKEIIQNSRRIAQYKGRNDTRDNLV